MGKIKNRKNKKNWKNQTIIQSDQEKLKISDNHKRSKIKKSCTIFALIFSWVSIIRIGFFNVNFRSGREKGYIFQHNWRITRATNAVNSVTEHGVEENCFKQFLRIKLNLKPNLRIIPQYFPGISENRNHSIFSLSNAYMAGQFSPPPPPPHI